MDPVGGPVHLAVAGEAMTANRGPDRGPQIIAVAYPLLGA